MEKGFGWFYLVEVGLLIILWKRVLVLSCGSGSAELTLAGWEDNGLDQPQPQPGSGEHAILPEQEYFASLWFLIF